MSHINIIFLDNYLLGRFRLLWHLLLHCSLALKHLHLLVWHFLESWQLHLVKHWPPVLDFAITEDLSEMDCSWLTWSKVNNFCGQRSNWLREYKPFRIPDFTAILYWSLSSLYRMTPRMFLGSPLPRSTEGIGTATLSSGLPGLHKKCGCALPSSQLVIIAQHRPLSSSSWSPSCAPPQLQLEMVHQLLGGESQGDTGMEGKGRLVLGRMADQ